MGNFLIYGGVAGCGISLAALFFCLWLFPRQRKKLLRHLGEETE